MKNEFNIIISGGGTGGHIYPALAIANKIKELYPQANILFIGALGKMEMEKVPQAGYRIVGLPIAGWQRKDLIKNVTLPFKLLRCLRHAKKVIKEFKPNVVVGVGGYASAPTLWMAARLGIPCLLQEQNSIAGITNKFLAKKAKRVCVAYEGLERFFPKEKINLTGNPVRYTIVPADAEFSLKGRLFFNIGITQKCLLVLGGSLGARALNECVKAYIERTQGDSPVDIIWQCGAYYRNEIEAFVAAHPRPWLHLHPFINRMELAYAAADVVVSRSGAGTVSELCIAGKAVIFVPSPNVAEDHQRFNALALVNQKAALMVPEEQALDHLMFEAIDLAYDLSIRERLERNITTLARPHAARDIVHEIVQWL